jgi:hypothetical protein
LIVEAGGHQTDDGLRVRVVPFGNSEEVIGHGSSPGDGVTRMGHKNG